ncbi:MAG: FmdE family protein [Thermoproteota archaeon]
MIGIKERARALFARLTPILLAIVLSINSSVFRVSASNGQDLLGVIQIYDESTTTKEIVLNNLTFSAMVQYFGIGDSPIMYCVWRASKLALAKLWPGEVPHRADIRVITAHPTRGAADAIEFITRAKSRWELYVEAPPGTSGIVQTSANWVFTFVRISTGQVIEIRVNETTVFPEGYHDIANSYRSKLVAGETPTKEETEKYKAAMKKVKDAFKTLPDSSLLIVRIFTFEAEPFDAEACISYYATPALAEFQRLKGLEAQVDALRVQNDNLLEENKELLAENEDLRRRLSEAATYQYVLIGGILLLLLVIIVLVLKGKRK